MADKFIARHAALPDKALQAMAVWLLKPGFIRPVSTCTTSTTENHHTSTTHTDLYIKYPMEEEKPLEWTGAAKRDAQ
jgi:hypothetical protein